MDWLTEINNLFQAFTAWANKNQVVALAVSAFGLTVIGFAFRTLPMRIWAFIKRQSTTTLSFTNDPVGVNALNFIGFMQWFEQNQGRWQYWSRSIALNSADVTRTGQYGGTIVEETQIQAGIGNGSHFFIYRGRPMWMRRTQLEKGSIQVLVYEIEITMLGRNRQKLLDLFEEFRYVPPPQEKALGIYRWSEGGDWYRAQNTPPRALRSVIIDAEVKRNLLADVQQWRESEAWYIERGLPYKLTCLLCGLPGTGKTSLIKALASHLKMNLCVLNMNKLNDDSFAEALSEARANSIIVIEDFDSAIATRARSALKPKATPSDKAAEALEDMALSFGLTLSGILNSLDGLVGLHNKIIFLTTNVRESIDPALLRKGRVDITYELQPLRDAEVREYIELMFPGTIVKSLPFADILGCDLQDLYFQHRHNAADFVAAIPRRPTAMIHSA